MRTEHLEYLVETVDSGSMSKAAKDLYLTQPAISNALNSLEEAFGFQLLDRSKGGVKPTELGRMIVDDSRVIVNIMRRWKKMSSEQIVNENVDDEIFIADLGEVGFSVFFDSVMGLNQQYPKLVLHMVSSDNVLRELNNGKFSIACVPVIPMEAKAVCAYLFDHQWLSEPLFDGQWRAVAGAAADAEKLTGKRLLLREDFPYEKRLADLLHPAEIRRTDVMSILNSVMLEDDAVGFLPPVEDKLISRLESGGLIKSFELTNVDMPVSYYLTYSERMKMVRGGQLALESIRSYYKDK